MMEKKNYCTQNGGDCPTCSLVNYGRDCQNNPVNYAEGGSDDTAAETVMIKAELTEQEAGFLTDLLDNVTGLNVLDPESRGSVRKIIQSIQDKIKLRGADENSIF